MYGKLASIAFDLDACGLYKEADIVTQVLRRISKKKVCNDCGGNLSRNAEGGNLICNQCGRPPKKVDNNFEPIKTRKTWDKDNHGKSRKTREMDQKRENKILEREYASREAQYMGGNEDKWCPECGAPNQFGETCQRCMEDIQSEFADDGSDGWIPDDVDIPEDEEDSVWPDSHKSCPECETPNQFGELCEKCLKDRMTRNRIQPISRNYI